MKILRDTRLDELKRIEHLLYGNNYEVWFNLYGPGDADMNLGDALKDLISKECELSGVAPSSPKKAISEIMDMILYEGDISSGPLELESKKSKITELMTRVFSIIGIENADMVLEFGFKSGYPAYPVYWGFAFDIRSKDRRWIFVGSSSD